MPQPIGIAESLVRDSRGSLRRIGANQLSLVACIGPLATIGLAHVFVGEPVTMIQLVGATLVLAGVIIISFKPQAQA